MFNVLVQAIGTDTWEPIAVGPFDTGKEAAEVAMRLRDQHGATHRYKVRPVAAQADDNTWKEREDRRFFNNEYLLVPWHWSTWNDAMRREHFAHLSLKQPGKIAFTETPEKGRQDRQTIIAPGRYLQRYFSDVLSANEIERFAAEVSVQAGSCEIKFTQDADEIEELYVNGPNSCMSHDADDYSSHCHPTRVYAGPDLALAYIGDLDDASARCVVWPVQKRYSTIYGDRSRMRLLLEDAGFSSGSLNGARIRRIVDDEDDHSLVMPYIDDTGYAEPSDCGKFLILGNGSVYCQNTCGTTRERSRPTCDACGDSYDEDDGFYIADVHETWCEHCYDHHAQRCEWSGDSYSTNRHEFHEVWQIQWHGGIGTITVADRHLDSVNAVYLEDLDVYAEAGLAAAAEAIQALAQALLETHQQPSLFPCEQTLADAWTVYALETLGAEAWGLAA